MSESSSSAPSFRFGPRERRGVLLGLDVSQVATLGTGATTALVALLVDHQLAVAALPLAAASVWAFLPLRGRALRAWATPAATHLVGRRSATAPITAHPLPSTARSRCGPRGRDGERGERATRLPAQSGWNLPGIEHLRIEDAPDLSGALGLARLGGGGPVSFTLCVSAPHFSLVDEDEQARIVSSWGEVLCSCASSGIARLQVTERAVPEIGASQLEWLLRSKDHLDLETLRAYASHIGMARAGAVRHELYLTAVLRKGSARDIEARASSDCSRLMRSLESAGFGATALSAIELEALVKEVIEPGCSGREPVPRAWERRWGLVRTGSCSHASYEATELPRVEVGADWAWPLLVSPAPESHRTIALHVELAPAKKGLRRAERSALRTEADDQLRRRHDFRIGALADSQMRAVLERESELAAGHADARFALLVGVTAKSEEALSGACAQLETQASQAQVSLSRLDGQHPEALVASLPLALLRLKGGWG